MSVPRTRKNLKSSEVKSQIPPASLGPEEVCPAYYPRDGPHVT
jgi:hypothetical protein